MENDREIFDRDFKIAVTMYGHWMKSRCRVWSNSKFDFDDLYSECLLVTMRVVQYNSHLGIESKEFKNLLFRSCKNRLIDLQRRFSTQRRDRMLEVPYESSWDDDRLAEAFTMTSLPVQPDELIETIQLARKLEQKLDEIDRKMLRQLLDPCSELLQRARDHEKAVAEKSNRRSNGAHTEIAVHLLGKQIGLSYKQALSSLTRIRSQLTEILSES